jgi:hypothetical protein
MYRVGARMELCGTSACTSRGVDMSHSTVILNFMFESNELINLIMLSEKCNLESVYITRQGAK